MQVVPIVIEVPIPQMAGGDTALAASFLALVAKEIRSKHRAEHLPFKMLMAERKPKVPPVPTELTPQVSKKKRRGTSSRSGHDIQKVVVGDADRPSGKKKKHVYFALPSLFIHFFYYAMIGLGH